MGCTSPPPHRRLDAHRTVLQAAPVFTTRSNGKSFPKWRHTLKNATRYLDGLLSPGTGKTMSGIARRMDVHRDKIEGFVRESPWDWETLQDHLTRTVPDAMRSSKGLFVIDEVPNTKQGEHSVGVARQYNAEVGKVGSCQVAVNLVYTVPGRKLNKDHDTHPLGMRLYLPKTWAGVEDAYEDRAEERKYAKLRRMARVPDDVEFRTKPQIALGLIERVRQAGLEHRGTVGDAVYGDSAELRATLREWGEPYVLGVNPSRHHVVVDASSVKEGQRVPDEDVCRVDRLMDGLGGDGWQDVVWGRDPEGEDMVARCREVGVRVVMRQRKEWVATGEAARLLVEDRGGEVKAWLCWGLAGASFKQLVRWAHTRWAIEQFHRNTKQALGWGEFEGRTWQGWHHHASMVLLAHAFVARVRSETGREGMGKVSFEEVVREIAVEVGTQTLVEEGGLDREAARESAVLLLRRWFGWV